MGDCATTYMEPARLDAITEFQGETRWEDVIRSVIRLRGQLPRGSVEYTAAGSKLVEVIKLAREDGMDQDFILRALT